MTGAIQHQTRKDLWNPDGLHYSWFIIAALIVFSLVERFHEAHANWMIWAVTLVTQHPAEIRFPPAYQHLLYRTSKVVEGRV